MRSIKSDGRIDEDQLLAKIIQINKCETSDERFIRRCFFISKIMLTSMGACIFIIEIHKRINHEITFYTLSFLWLLFCLWIIYRILTNKF